MESDIHYPTDTGLLNDGIKVLTRAVTGLKKVVPGIGRRFVNHTRLAKKLYLGLVKTMRGRTGKDAKAVKKTRRNLVKLSEKVIASARAVKKELALHGKMSPVVRGLTRRLEVWLDAVDSIVGQTKEVIKGNRHLPHRLVSLFDTGARPIRKGKSHKDTEFGRKLLIGETDHGIISTYEVLKENPSEVTLLQKESEDIATYLERDLRRWLVIAVCTHKPTKTGCKILG